MNRVVSKRFSVNVYGLSITRRNLCNNAASGVFSSSTGQTSHEHEVKQNVTDDGHQYDVAIVGGGVVGMALACSLAHSPLTKHLKVAIIDSNPALGKRDCINKEDPPDPRVSIVTPATISIFKEIGAWQYIQQQRHAYFDKMQVGADGGNSRVRELAGFKTTGWNYSQKAVICTVEHTEENQCAWQQFLPAGPIALLPIGDKFSNIVWTMNPKESWDCKTMNEDEFVKTLNHALDYGYGPHPKSNSSGGQNMFSWLIAGVTLSANECFKVPPKVIRLASDRMVFPLSLKHANNYASRRVVLIGDAAQTVNPLAGLGDSHTLSRVIAGGIAVGKDIGRVTLLKNYEVERKSLNIMMMASLEVYQKAYPVDLGPLNILRAAAFNWAPYNSPLLERIISSASGEQ